MSKIFIPVLACFQSIRNFPKLPFNVSTENFGSDSTENRKRFKSVWSDSLGTFPILEPANAYEYKSLYSQFQYRTDQIEWCCQVFTYLA